MRKKSLNQLKILLKNNYIWERQLAVPKIYAKIFELIFENLLKFFCLWGIINTIKIITLELHFVFIINCKAGPICCFAARAMDDYTINTKCLRYSFLLNKLLFLDGNLNYGT